MEEEAEEEAEEEEKTVEEEAEEQASGAEVDDVTLGSRDRMKNVSRTR